MPAALNPRRFYERLLDQRARSDPRGNEVLMRGLEKKESLRLCGDLHQKPTIDVLPTEAND